MYQVIFEEWDGRIYEGLMAEENYIPGPAQFLPDELAFESSFQSQGWPCCGGHRGDDCSNGRREILFKLLLAPNASFIFTFLCSVPYQVLTGSTNDNALLIAFAVVGGLLFIPLYILCSKWRRSRRDRLAIGATKK